ncbi:Fungal Zn(2)-Cys(6) binuclear cluster domain [Rhizoctonia solani]|uniref:Fungal Zn(2)-Cys(6) binuclear cluster domain n=1 Tax=Rhizoctonia solani TaxID=456999 RepID=A0A8H8SUU6_9AGAM|nr:Fungal Zn(2)-Cys(6) binuclear cluster domain [Rhizoctonia solani]QRW18614.1 Fungal Zn(2)-Cys(6) binuclear cluster domain [Rhizoctonia solani]
MSLRSTTGCSTCKTKRKKCDETKPKCLKCVQKGLNCEYQYVEPTGRGTRIRTKPAPRPPSEQAKLLAKQQASLKEASELVNVAEGLETPAELFEPSLAPPLRLRYPPIRTGARSFILSPPMAPQYSPLPRILTSGQASLFDALFSLDKDGSAWRVDDRSNSALLTSSNEHMSDQSRPTVHPPLDLVPDTDTSEYEDDEDDRGPGEAFCQSPIVLDRTVDSNLLVFVLHSYAQLMPLVIFDPLKPAPGPNILWSADFWDLKFPAPGCY